MKKKFVRLISAVLSAAMTLTAVPLSAFAEGEEHTHDGESNVITTPLDFREKKADENGAGWSWDYDTKTLTLDGVNIQATTDSMSVVTVPDGTEIVLKGENTIVQTDTGDSYTYVLSAVNNQEVNCDGTMTISGDGVLNAENRSTDSMARSLGGTIIINGGTVNATGKVVAESLEIHNDGALNAEASAVSNDGAAVGVKRGITVDGNGSLTAVGGAVENEYVNNGAILLNSNFGDKISVSGNGSITVPEGNAAKVGIYYDGNKSIDAEISGGKVTAYGTKCGIYKVNLIMSGTGSVYTTGGSYAIGQTVPTIDEDEFVVKGSTEFKAEESSVTANAKYNSGYYEIDGADAKTVVIKPDTSPRIILGKQTGIFKTEEYELIEDIDMTDIKLKGTVYFDITLKNMSDEEFADARGYFGGDEPDLSASIIKTDYGWVCMVCDTEFSTTYDTDNTLTIKCGDIVSNTVQVKSNANRFNKVTQGDNTNRTVFYTNTSQEEKDNYKLVSTYTVDSESISYNWYSTNSAYSADELGAAVSGTGGEFKLADNIPAGNYVLYCDIAYSDGDSTETVTEKFTFTYKECAHENGYSDGKCTNCGALCDHSDIDIGTGKCNECKRQFVATISTDGSAPKGYDTLADCLDSITADTGNYVKIYQDIGDTSATATLDTIDVKHNVMIDLNGHKLNNIKLGVNKDVKLALTGTAGSYVTQVYVRKGGSFVIDSDANAEFNTIFVEADAGLAVNDGAKVTTGSLTVKASVNDDGTTTTSVKLATGMKLGELTYHRQNNSGVVKLGNLLDVTRQALQRDDNGEYLDLYKEYGGMGYPFAFTVVEHTDADHKYDSGTGKCKECGKPCEHSGDINTDTGICSICGAVVSVAIYTDANGISKYVDTDELHSLLNEYNGSGTVKLFKDYSKPSAQYDLYGELTIDLNGRQFKIRSITPCKNGKLTIKNSGNPVMLGCNVYPTNDASYAGGTLIIDGDVVLDTSIYVYDSSTVILKDGTYHAGLYARDSKTLYDMLGEGKAFFKTDGTLFNASVKEISSSVTLIVKDHSHTYVDGKCDCGYVCGHTDVNIDTGKCTECEYQYAAVIVKDGAVASVYTDADMATAFEAADSDANTGCTLKVYKNYAGSYTTLSGKFTLWIAEKANVGTLTVSGDITVTGSEENNSIYGDFNVADGGKLTFDENCGAKGTVSVGAGTFDCYRSLGIILNINDASSDVILHGGAFIKIRYNGGGDRANAEILTLLAENRMFMSPSVGPIDGSKTLLKDGFATTVGVIRHEDHVYDSTTGKCTICGKRCGHTDVDSKTGVCPTCKYQLTAGISGVGTAKYFDNIDNAFTAALSAENNGCTLTLYKDCELSQNIVIGNATVTVDMNGHSILLAYRIKVNDGGVLYLKNSGENGSIETEIDVNKGGTLINGTADDSRSAVSVFGVTADAAKRVEIYGGSCTGLTVNNGTSGIALYGGSYESINTNDLTDSTPVSALLAKGYAFATLNSFTHLPESIVDGSETNLNPGLENVMVVAHTHTYTETNPKCACGAVLYAKVTSADGTSNKYFDSIEEGLLYADKAENKGCVFTLVAGGLLKDKVTLSSGQFTIATATTNNNYVIGPYEGKITIDGADVIAEGDLAFRCNVCVESGSLTLPEGSGTGFDSIIISGGTVTISEGVNVDSYAGADNLSVDKDATDVKLTIGGGTYGNVYFGQLKLKDVLASGVRVISYDNPSDPTAEKTATALLYSDIAEESSLNSNNGTVSYYLVTKCDHKNEDGSYAFNEGGICKYCNSEFAASVSYTDGGEKTELFGDIIDAFDKANEIGTATITLYKNSETSKLTQDITVTGNVTLALNGKTFIDKVGRIAISTSNGGTLTVNGDGNMQTRIEVNANSKLIVNGGELADVSVYEEGNAEIKGGVIKNLAIYGNAKISGGKFYIIGITNGSLESVLADGYAYKKEGGEWLSIAERAKGSYYVQSTGDKPLIVEKAPIESASIAWAGGEAPVIYRNGDKYLNVSVTYTLADGSRGVTYSDYVNGNNRSKDSNLYTNIIAHCYEIGKLAAKDGEVEYYTVLKCNGYEYKSNVLKFTIATCSHPEDRFNYENNGLVICGICAALIEAEVVDADGKSLGYADIESAIKLAQENEGSTVKLMSDGVSGDITVTDGRFTVDFNGKKVFYQFAVSGGDVTFTSSVEQADVETLISGIEVNGTDAKVTIDGKIKLGSVTLSSGTLTVNSTQGYIKELSINGGNAVIDDAIIGALKANGGDTVINCVEADSLSVNINGSGSISIVIGEFGSTTCKTGLGMAIASGSVVFGNSMNGITVYTYEAIQTMTKTDRIFVDKCVHKGEKGSYVLDGNPCPYCNEEIVATVSYTANGGEETDLFSDIYDAFDKANEIGTATVTLYKDITDDITDTIAVTGNVTLELNGKKLSTSGFDPYYAIEVKSGKLTVNGSGTIKCVVVRNGGDAEINGGIFSDFRIEDGGNAVINGGKFNSIKVSGEGRNVGQLLADGYAYKNFDGFWSTVAEREKRDIANVNVLEAPIKSASIAWYGGGTPVVYRNGVKNLDVNVTYDVADTSKDITYSDFVNGNNRSKDSELSGNWYMVFGYEIGDIIAKDGEVEYYTVLKCDGYEYKSNVLKLTLATCSHPEDSFTEKYNDGSVYCGICDLLIGAQVIKADGEPLGYADMDTALKLAQENEGSTIKLISERVSVTTSVTVTGGKFTVDFNGKEVYYNFDVNGGDVTFTSSVKQADAENPQSTIKVNGTDAKVTIDGKIKLLRARTLSGTLTVNSTDGYIGELSTEGGKTDIDGARIGALKTFGGEAVIKNVTADSLAMCDDRSGGSKYNISIVSGRFGSFTCETDSGYTIGKVMASGSSVQEKGEPCYYDSVKNRTGGTDLVFSVCDHKNNMGRPNLNDANVCNYCNLQIVATVSYTVVASEEIALFTDIYDAFAKANEAGTATITLYKDIADSELTRDVNVTGNVTLALNGKKLGDSYDGKYIQSSDGGELTVNGDGKIAKTVRAKKNSKLTINSGEFDWVIIDEGGDAVISGGSIAAVNINGNAELSGGKFYIIAVYGTLESMLADGYAYKIDGGAWLSIADRARSGYSNVDHEHKPVTVEEAPIKSATITAEDESPIIYRNGSKAASFTADVTYTGNETLYVTRCLIDGTVIREKTVLSDNSCYLLGDQVDKVVAEDGEIQYYCIFTYDGYEYKSNVVTLTVATCQHPSESVKCDDNGNYVCGICDSTLTASVELSDGTLSYYGNWNDAIGAAEDSEGCTLKLLDYIWLNFNETFDISKGRFTVDFNKDDGSGRFTFNVKGGDITFTTSQATSNPWARVQVSGENANVLIDSKARLNGLVVNSGKVTVDGANIGAITINGGDTVFNYVKADYLSMKADTTGGSGYNVSIVSGTFNNFTCENESNYTLGRAIASGSRVTGFDVNVGLYKYADIQKKTEIANIIVEKCNHKDANDSYVLDGKPCPYCNEEIAATVSYTADGSEQTDLFSDIYDAFAKANEVGTATVTLYKDIENSEFTRYITVTGNVTLALNGKKLGYSFVSLTVEVSDGGMLTVDGDGKMMVPIIVNENAKLTVNGGEIATVMIYKDGDAVIGGGFIEDLDVNGNVKLSGGKFDNIEIANGSLESILADGYAYKKDGGAWLSIAERAKEKYYSWNNEDKPVTVEEAPIKSATLSTKINKLYRNSNANPTLKFNLALAIDTDQNDSDVRMRYGINSYESGDTVYSSLRPLLSDTKLLADVIIDKAGDSDAAKIYYVVTTGDGYEIKSNTVSIDIVDCDHSQVVDPTADKEIAGNITEPTYCEICESKFNAKITKGDDVKYYDDLDDAAKDAQKSENEGCTLYPLYNKKGYVGQLVINDGNFTLKYAVRTAFSNPVVIKGNAKLKVTGRCAVTESENQDAFTVNDGDVTFDGLATGSNVTINGGNVTMTGNNINRLTINGGNVSISSGGFAEIVTNAENKVIADYIDPGFWVQDRGTKEWIDIYSLDKATASSTNVLSVRLCPMQIIKPIDTVYYTNGYYPEGIPSLQINAEPWYSDEVNAKVAYQWIAIDENGNETVIEGATDRKLSLENLTTGRYYCSLTYSSAATAGVSMASNVVTATITECEHSGGEATCTEKAKCEICGAEYGEPLGHEYIETVVAPTYTSKGYTVFECTRCKHKYNGNFVPVKPIPDVEEIAVEKMTYDEVNISWKNISGVDGYYVEGYVGDQWTKFSFSTDGDRGVAKLSGLSAGLKYKVRIAAYAGSFTGKFRYFYVDTVPSPVWNINTVKATDETVRISWNRNTRADGYKVEWYIDNQWSVKTVTGNNNIAAVIDGLCAGTRYKVRVSAYKGDLYSPYTYGYIDTLPSKVTGITQTVTSSSFTLKWDKNESADGYTVQYYADGKWNEKSLVGNDKTAVTIGSLKGYKTYKVRIKAYKGELQSAFDDIYITTAPTKVSGLKVKSAVDSKAVVIWNADTNADGYTVGYYIGGKWIEKTITDNKTAMAELDGLTPYSTYKVRVRAYKGDLYGDYSYTTVTAVLSPVTNIKVVSAKSNSITVKWGKNASADGYKVEIYKGGKWVKKTLKGSANATVTIDGLKAGSVYKVRIASYKGANTSAYTYANVNTAK